MVIFFCPWFVMVHASEAEPGVKRLRVILFCPWLVMLHASEAKLNFFTFQLPYLGFLWLRKHIVEFGVR